MITWPNQLTNQNEVLARVGEGGDHVILKDLTSLLHEDNFRFQGLQQLPESVKKLSIFLGE